MTIAYDTTDCPLSGSLRQAPRYATFDRRHAELPDGGAVLLKAAERVYGSGGGFRPRVWWTDGSPGRSGTRWRSLLGQRDLSALHCGHPDGNDADHARSTTRSNKLLLGRDPVGGGGVENLAADDQRGSRTASAGLPLYRAWRDELAMRVIERHQRRLDGRARRITIDLDADSTTRTHGASAAHLLQRALR